MTGLLDGRVAVVTGAGHGIGRGHALELAAHGAKVVVNDLGTSVTGDGKTSSRDADEVVALINAQGGDAVADYGDVSSAADAEAMIARAIEAFGRLDIVVNNAGIVRDGVIWKMSEADFDKVMAVHVRGTWLLSHFAAIHWRARAAAGETLNARIINTTSGAGLQGNFGQSNYTAAKAAIAGLTLTLSLELNRLGVTVNCISPAASTRISATIPGWQHVVREAEEVGEAYDPLSPNSSSPVVAWLASTESHYLNGQVLKVVGDDLSVLRPWVEVATISNGGQRWDAEKLGSQVAGRLYKVHAPGLAL